MDHSGKAGNRVAPLTWTPRPEIVKETRSLDVKVGAAETSHARIPPPPIASAVRPVNKFPPAPQTSEKPTPVGLGDVENGPTILPEQVEVLIEHGKGRVEVPPPPSTATPIHWVQQSEHFPIPSASTIQLPSGSPKPIPKIQYSFKEESSNAKADREGKLKAIKDAFMHAWSGYKRKAWMKDELAPVSGAFRNPFNFWGATLVDTLDTLWIMGLEKEFKEAVQAVGEIDFTTSPRPDIPLFETTIRYLGGLVAAYDISGQKYEVLLKKAVELAEVLMGAFDTPNRMPITYYFWRPTFASQPHRANTRVILAEIGSLSVEFTRLAQLTGEPKYYDAIARITDALDVWQNQTRLPGMWPTYLDASGCKRPEFKLTAETTDKAVKFVDKLPLQTELPILESDNEEMIPLKLPKPLVFVAGEQAKGNSDNNTEVGELTKKEDSKSSRKMKRQLEVLESVLTDAAAPSTVESSVLSAKTSTPAHPECEDQGLVSTSEYSSESFTLGGMSDSTYEYLPKQYLLLGGLVEQYRRMYESAMDVVKEYIIFRPMFPGDPDLLFSGSFQVSGVESEDDKIGDLEAEHSHLSCFVGGMFALGAKIFDREEDLEMAKKLTEGCVYAYNATNTGIMPESFYVVACDSLTHCKWNKTKQWDTIDPYAESRHAVYEQQLKKYHEQLSSASAEAELAASATAAPPEMVFKAEATPTSGTVGLQKRQIDLTHIGHPKLENKMEEEPPETSITPSPTFPILPILSSPYPPLSHEDFVKSRIQEERLPPGFVSIRSKKYILRPEAIESVWYLYRITGDSHWREAGWEMFTAIQNHTVTTFGHSAIDDVTAAAPELLDEMESFWLAETLKYFYLLFADEGVVSLDEWVLNTEAHPFRRPK